MGYLRGLLVSVLPWIGLASSEATQRRSTDPYPSTPTSSVTTAARSIRSPNLILDLGQFS